MAEISIKMMLMVRLVMVKAQLPIKRRPENVNRNLKKSKDMNLTQSMRRSFKTVSALSTSFLAA